MIGEQDYGRKNLRFEYMLLYQKDEDKNGVCCKVRLGSRRYIQLSNIAEGSLEIAPYIKKKGEEPYYCGERLPDEQEGTLGRSSLLFRWEYCKISIQERGNYGGNSGNRATGL